MSNNSEDKKRVPAFLQYQIKILTIKLEKIYWDSTTVYIQILLH